MQNTLNTQKNNSLFNCLLQSYKYEDEKERVSDLRNALATFRLSIPDNCPLWTSKIALAGEKPFWLHKDEPNFADFAYLKTATDFKVGTLIIDIDKPIADYVEAIIYSTLNAPIPNLIIKNRVNKHVQLVYCLTNWVCIDVSNSKGNYSAKAHALYKALKKHLNSIFGGDDAYHNFIAKNPYSKHWDVVGMRSASYEMYELARISQLEVKSTPFIDRLKAKSTQKAMQVKSTVQIGERNQYLFDTVRQHAYTLYNKYGKKWTFTQFEDCLNEFAQELNSTKCAQPLDTSEVATICHSITSFCYGRFGDKQRMTKSEISKIASKCGKKGGKAKGYAYSKQRQQARKLHRMGKKAKDIAEITGLSIRSVYNAISAEKQPKTAKTTTKSIVQKKKEKIIKYQVFKPYLSANNYQCSISIEKDCGAIFNSELEIVLRSNAISSSPVLYFPVFSIVPFRSVSYFNKSTSLLRLIE